MPDASDEFEEPDLGRDLGFAPNNPTDGRQPGKYASRYSIVAWLQIVLEAIYIAVIFAAYPIAMYHVLFTADFNAIMPSENDAMLARPYAISWLSGTFGGTLLGLKWMYHSVARGLWNRDRVLWRLFTPHISGGVSFAIYALATSGILRVFDTVTLREPGAVIGISFLVGYFSDNALAKLAELADKLFGSSSHERTSP